MYFSFHPFDVHSCYPGSVGARLSRRGFSLLTFWRPRTDTWWGGGGGQMTGPHPTSKFVRVGVPIWDVVDGTGVPWLSLPSFLQFYSRLDLLASYYAQHIFILFTVTFKFSGIRALAYLTLRMSFQVIYSKHVSLYDKRHYMQHVILIIFFWKWRRHFATSWDVIDIKMSFSFNAGLINLQLRHCGHFGI